MAKKYVLSKYNKEKTLVENLLLTRVNAKDNKDKSFWDIEIPKFHGLEVALERIKIALKNKEKIGIATDSDSDGIGGTAIFMRGLRNTKLDVIHNILCDRKTGYGLQNSYYDEFKRIGITLIITADIGVSGKDAVAYGKSIGIDTIVTDHHQHFEESEPDCIILNPANPKNQEEITPYCGAGVAYWFVKAIHEMFNLKFDENKILLHHATVSTIGDMVSLIDGNYLMVKEGLKTFHLTESKALKWLLEEAIKIGDNVVDTTNISFGIVPIINSLNRVSDPAKGVDFLLSESIPEIHTLGRYLVDRNNYRKEAQIDSIINAENMINKKGLQDDKLIMLNMNTKKSLCGLVASYICNSKYGVPSIVLSENPLTGVIGGSGRSTPGLSAVNLLEKLKREGIICGGHPGAFGITVGTKENLPIVQKCIDEFIDENMQNLNYDIEVTKNITIEDVDEKFISDIYSVGPYGMGNKAPLFMMKNIQISDIECRKFNTFLKMEEVSTDFSDFNKEFKQFDAIFFKADLEDSFDTGDVVNILFNISSDGTILLENIKHA